MIKISIVVPIYNIESYVKTCIDSIINQTYQNLQIILINDGSKDKSGEICDTFAKRDSRVKVIHTSNKGLSAARNEGIRRSSGDYIMFIDGDDYITLNALEDIVRIINEQNNIDIITGKMILYYNDTKQVKENFDFDQNKISNKSGLEVLNYYFEEIPAFMWSACRSIYKRQLLTDNELYFTEGITSEDLDLIPRIFMCADKVAVYNKPFYYYRKLRPDSIINTVNTKKIYDIVSIIKKHIINLQKKHYSERFKKAFLMQLANAYAYYVGLLGELSKDDRKKAIREMKKIENILVYTRGFVGRSIFIFTKILGFEITSLLYSAVRRAKLFLFNLKMDE
jgi:glycosyltransferase involved in cell wall biosynthesis